VAGGTRDAQRADERERVRPSLTHADEVLANASGENFPVALRMLPARYRQHLFALYCFARLTDDIGDQAKAGEDHAGDNHGGDNHGGDNQAGDNHAGESDGTATMRLKLLDDLEADIDRIYAGDEPLTPALRPLAEAVRACGIPDQPLRALIQANRQDQLVARYPAYEDLVRYCTLSANPVGQVVLYIFGVATTERITLSDSICTALQLVEHWQDVAEDLGNGRIYLPQEDLARFGCTEADLAQPHANETTKQLISFEVARARQLLDEGAPLVGTLRGAARLAVAGYVGGGRAALAAIEDHGYDVLAATPRPRKSTTVKELAKAYLRGR
jgi:squalene synthase HpnC